MVTTSIGELRALLAKELAESSDEERESFDEVSVPPAKWQQSPWGDAIGGFWALAVLADRVLWYNELEGGFNVSKFSEYGTIPEDEYWCNQDHIAPALRELTKG